MFGYKIKNGKEWLRSSVQLYSCQIPELRTSKVLLFPILDSSWGKIPHRAWWRAWRFCVSNLPWWSNLQNSINLGKTYKNKWKTSESYFRVKLEKREFWQNLQLSGVLEFWKLEMGDRKYLLNCLWAEREWKSSFYQL